MQQPISRRQSLATLSGTVVWIAGCIGDGTRTDRDSEDSNRSQNGTHESSADWKNVDWEETCGVETGTWEPTGEPVERTIQTDDKETETQADHCAMTAVDVAFETLDERLGTDMQHHDSKIWSLKDREEALRVGAQIWVDHDGDLRTCPPSEFDVESVRNAMPETVSITLEFTDSESQYECTHDILLVVKLLKDD